MVASRETRVRLPVASLRLKALRSPDGITYSLVPRYLTADSPNVLTTIQVGKVYIVGGLIDNNHHKGIAHGNPIVDGCDGFCTTAFARQQV
jgi:hypothetical protein